MLPGDVFADRFTIERQAGAGGMGTVYRARDALDGGCVALKVLHDVGGGDPRFQREAALLAELQHPRIVRYLAHGATRSGQGWLAMEWLDGEDLSTRLLRGGLSLGEGLAVVRRAAEGLAHAHQRGIVHRDVKPGNVFLPDGSIDRLKVLDFGVARAADARGPTRTGTVIGTPAYMAPEQARGSRDVAPSADVFALGCVLFELVTGRPPFAADTVMAVLAKVLLEEAPAPSSVRPTLPPTIDALVAALLAKAPGDRLCDAAAVVSAIDALGDDVGDGAPPDQPARAAQLGALEQRLVCVVVAPPPAAADPLASTIAIDDEATAVEAARAALLPLGARVEWLADGSVVVAISGAGTPTDLVVRAARCALVLRPLLGARPVFVATGRGVVEGRVPVGDAVDRAVSALAGLREPGIWLDEATAVLLDSRFAVQASERGPVLAGERERDEVGRKLLGKPTRFVGREREMGTLMALHEECVAESIPRAALVLAPPGAGKTRLIAEVRSRLTASAAVEPLAAHGDPTAAGAPWSLLGSALRRAAGIVAGDPRDAQRAALARRLARSLGGDALERAVRFLAHVAGVDDPAPDADAGRAAPGDHAFLADGIRAAWITWVEAEAQAAPVVLILDDLQWGDLPSLKLVDAALRALATSPLFVLAAARPEVHAAFPGLWTGREVQEVRLGALTPRASERLVRGALGEAADDAVVASVVTRAQGNAFFLEELVRAVAKDGGATLPDSVLGTVQARLDAVGADARRVLRAASVFGVVFWRGGVTHLLGGEQRTTGVAEWLDDLERREIVLRHPDSSVRGDLELSFQHGLLRDAAYAMLTGEDRRLGHRLAAEWLEVRPDVEPLVLAEHWSQAEEPLRAAPWFLRAGRAAHDAADLGAALERARRAVACGATGALRGEARWLEAETLHTRGSYAETLEVAREAMALLDRGSSLYFQAATLAVMAATRTRATEELEALSQQLLVMESHEDATEAWCICLSTCARMLMRERLQADAFLVALDAFDAAALGPQARASIVEARARRAEQRGDLGEAIDGLERALAEIGTGNVPHLIDVHRCHVAQLSLALGDLERADQLSAAAATSTGRCGYGPVDYAAVVRANVMLALGRSGEARSALAVAERIPQDEARATQWLRYLHARIAAAEGDAASAERLMREAAETRGPRALRAMCLAALADLLLERGRVEEAAELARSAMATTPGADHLTDDLVVHVTLIRVLGAAGQIEEAAAAAARGREVVLARAATLDERRRALYLASSSPAAILAAARVSAAQGS